MTDTNPFNIPSARVRLTEHDDGTTTATVRGRSHHGALETFNEIAGTFTVYADDDTDARIRRETWLIRHGLDPSYAGVASWVDSMIEKENNA